MLLGDRAAALDQEFHEDIRYGLVVNCTPDIPFLKNRFTRYWRVPVLDIGDAADVRQLALFMPSIVGQIEKSLDANETVLVHGASGRQRSAAVAAACLMKIRGMCCDEAVEHLRSECGAFHPEVNFYDALVDFEKKLDDGYSDVCSGEGRIEVGVEGSRR